MSDRNAVYFTISDITQTQRFETKLYDPPEGFFKYFRESHARGLKDETIKALAPGATLKRRFTIDQPEMVFLDLKITFKRKPFPLPELMLGNSQLIVSEKIKEVIEANDDETHQFHPISLFGEDGKPLDEPQRYGLIVNRVVEVPEPRAGMKIPKHYGNIGNYKLNSIEDTPGLATALAEFPIWSFPYFGTAVVLNEKMMRAILDSNPVGIKIRDETGGTPGENIQEIWFAELN